MALQINELDAYNEVFTLSFHQSNVDETMTWDVNTPFSRGAAGRTSGRLQVDKVPDQQQEQQQLLQ